MKRSPLKSRAVPRKLPQSSVSQLTKKADQAFSLMIRLRDADKHGIVECITCGVRKHYKEMHCGHFMSRRYRATRWNEENCNGQCSGCNTFRAGEQYKYALALDLKYGTGTAKRLSELAGTTRKIMAQELEEIIATSKELIKEYEEG